MSGVPPQPRAAQGESGRGPGATRAPGDPSDFTRIIGGSPGATPVAPASRPADDSEVDSAATPPRRSHRLLLLVALAAVFVVAVALVLFFARGAP